MAIDCYQKFKSTYNQAVADGLAVAVATAAAQTAMDACLQQQAILPPVSVPQTNLPTGRIMDAGPTRPKTR